MNAVNNPETFSIPLIRLSSCFCLTLLLTFVDSRAGYSADDLIQKTGFKEGVLDTSVAPQSFQAPNSLAPCPKKPNCVSSFPVSSESPSRNRIDPLLMNSNAIQGASVKNSIKRSKNLLHQALEAFDGVDIVRETPEYLHVTFKTKVFSFTDDVEFLIEEGGAQIHVRSASRVGYYDFKANRKRIEKLRKKIAEILVAES